jgi:5-(carboxyamino)imidazole ribonucleotide synthase
VTRIIPPGSTIGVLGGGQLGRMFAMAARRLGYRVHTLAPEHDTPTGQIADLEVNAPYEDLDAVRAFARRVDIVTFEFENVSAAATAAAEEHAIVRPNGHALYVAQHREREKTFLASHGFPVVPFAAVRTLSDLAGGLEQVGRPAVLKTTVFGYDGKGQVAIDAATDAVAAWETLGRQEAVLEAFIDLECEISVIGARAVDGSRSPFGPFDNVHRRHILDVSTAPSRVPPRMAAEALAITDGVLDALDFVGILCIEFFVARDGRLKLHLYGKPVARPGRKMGHLTVLAPTSQEAVALVTAARNALKVPVSPAKSASPAAVE